MTTYFHITPYMSKSDYELEEGHRGQSRSKPCHYMWSMLLQNGVLSLLSSRDYRVLHYSMLHDMLLKNSCIIFFNKYTSKLTFLGFYCTILQKTHCITCWCSALYPLCEMANISVHLRADKFHHSCTLIYLHAIIVMFTAKNLIHCLIHSNSISFS